MKHKNETLYVVGIAALLSFWSVRANAQDEIDEPAGDIAEAQEDADFEGAGESFPGEPQMETSDSAGQSAPGTAVESDSEGDQAGPVWESYNDNLKSVAQEVTKGLRVEDVVEPPTEYHYAAFGKPDPFIPPILALKSEDPDAISGLEVPIVSPLQRFEVSELRLVGVWQLPSGERKAMIMTPQSADGSGQGIIARNGDPVGRRAGKILAIGDSFLTIREFKLAVDGTRQYEDIQLPMGEQDPNSRPGRLKFTPGGETTTIILDSDRPTPVPTTFTDPADKPADVLPVNRSSDIRSAAPAPSQVISAPIPMAQPQAVPANDGAGAQQAAPISSYGAPAAIPAEVPPGAAETVPLNTTTVPDGQP